MKEENLDQTIKETVTFLKEKSPGKNGIIRKLYFYSENRWLEFNKPDDIGDHIPFSSVAENNTTFAKKQVALWKNRMLDGIPIPKHKIPLPPFLEAQNVDDFLQGLAVIYIFFKEKEFLLEGEKISKAILKSLTMRSKMLASVSLPYIHLFLPEAFSPLKPNIRKKYFADSSSNGLICEKILDFGIWANNEELIIKARACIDAWLNTPTYKKYNLFPSKAIPKDNCLVIIPKPVTNLSYALLKSSQIKGGERHKNELIKILDTVLDLCYKGDGIYCYYNPLLKESTQLSLIATNAFCRLLIEASLVFKNEKYWNKAEQIVFNVAKKAFLDKKGTFWKKEMYEDDGEGDFTNLVMVLDKKREHKDLLKIIYLDIVKKYYLGKGVWRDYCLENMQKTAHTKYIGGMLKYLVLYRAYLKGEDLLSEKWFYFSQDR
jgi:hypothetical protein